jgi:hypothetical protein
MNLRRISSVGPAGLKPIEKTWQSRMKTGLTRINGGAAVLISNLGATLPAFKAAESTGEQEASEICQEADIYLYPLVMRDVTRKVMTSL